MADGKTTGIDTPGRHSTDFPRGSVATRSAAVWGGVMGAVLLLMRKAIAVPVLLVSLIAMIITATSHGGLSDAVVVIGMVALVFSALNCATSPGAYLYAKRMRDQGVLV